MNLSNKFRTWVPSHTAILQSCRFQENLGRTVVVLPLLAQVTVEPHQTDPQR